MYLSPQMSDLIITLIALLSLISILWDEDEEKWREVTEEDELNEMAELLAAVHKNRTSLNEFSSKVIAATKFFQILIC